MLFEEGFSAHPYVTNCADGHVEIIQGENLIDGLRKIVRLDDGLMTYDVSAGGERLPDASDFFYAQKILGFQISIEHVIWIMHPDLLKKLSPRDPEKDFIVTIRGFPVWSTRQMMMNLNSMGGYDGVTTDKTHVLLVDTSAVYGDRENQVLYYCRNSVVEMFNIPIREDHRVPSR